MAEEISVFDSDEFEQLVASRDLRISKALVETILKNLNGRKRHIHALSVLVEQEQTMYDITIDRQEFITTLEQNIQKLFIVIMLVLSLDVTRLDIVNVDHSNTE
jgi:hypothetical protein